MRDRYRSVVALLFIGMCTFVLNAEVPNPASVSRPPARAVLAPAPEQPLLDSTAIGPFVTTPGAGGHGIYMKVSPALLNGKFALELRQDGNVIITETLKVPADVTKAPTLVFLAHASELLEQLRAAEKENPGSVTLRITKDGMTLVDSSLTQYETATNAIRPGDKRSFTAKSNSACTDNCDQYYYECSGWCDPRGDECVTCYEQYQNCLANCPTCDDWVEVNRTKVGGRFTGTYNILGLYYCKVTSYYIVEEANAAECSPNRFRCESDTVTFFYGNQDPGDDGCCNYTDPEDISHSDYCGGDNCFN